MVDQSARNLDQVKVGDKVVVSYFQGLAAEVKKAGEGAEGVETEVASERSAKGERPAGSVGVTMRTVVTIRSVDTAFNTVSFVRSDGIMRVIAIETPEGREFIRGLRPGDRVEITYTEAVAMEVRPAE